MSTQRKIMPQDWATFRATGLFVFINSILHVFGWVLVVKEYKEELENGSIKEYMEVFPARTKYRGYDDEDTEEMHQQIGEYLKNTSEELYQESR